MIKDVIMMDGLGEIRGGPTTGVRPPTPLG
jgi:hypothetical protein